MLKILFICTHNRCRSVLSEAITNQVAEGFIQAQSAGSQPAGEVHPLSLKYLQAAGFSIENLKSQSWDEFESFEPDIVITVCDAAANEVCPVWFGKSLKLHWGLSDPSKLTGSETEIAAAFNQCIAEISKRAQRLKQLAKSNPNPTELRNALLTLINQNH